MQKVIKCYHCEIEILDPKQSFPLYDGKAYPKEKILIGYMCWTCDDDYFREEEY